MTVANAPDDWIREPLWEWPVRARMAVLRERRKRFGIPLEEIGESIGEG